MTNRRKGFSNRGKVVGKTPRTKHDQKTDQVRSNKVTMGNNVPRQTEGAVGDITVREVPVGGLRAYIKTDSGWYDLNAMTAGNVIEWRNIKYAVYNSVSSWIAQLLAEGQKAQYCRDSNGFVHFRGCIQNLKIADTTPTPTTAWETSQSHTGVSQTSTSGGGTRISCNIETDGSGNPTFALVDIGEGYDHGDTVRFTDPGSTAYTADITLNNGSTSDKNTTITTLPEGFRPYSTIIVAAAHVTAAAAIKITGAGVVSGIGNTTSVSAQFLDGVSFFSRQETVSVSTGQSGERGAVGSGISA